MVKHSKILALMFYCIACARVPHVDLETRIALWVADSLTRVQSTDPPGTSTTAIIKAARNEAEAFQVIIRAPDSQPLSNVNATVSDLVGPSTLSRSAITLYREHYVPVHVQSANLNNGWFAPHLPSEWPDALIPSIVPGGTYQSFPFSVPAGRNQPIWVEVTVPKGTAAGTYTGTVTVTANGVAPATIRLTLTVWGFTLPDRPALASDVGNYDGSFSIASQYSAGADHGTLKATLYAALQAHRLGIGDAKPTQSPHYTTLMPRQRVIEVDPGMTDAQVIAIRDDFVAKGWGDALGVFPIDEPQTQAQYDIIKQLAPRFRALGIPLLTTIQNSTAWMALDGAVDIWVPVFYECILDAAQILTKLAKGERVWSYAAGVQPNSAPTWLLDYDLIDYRIPAWLNYGHGQTGLLYWTTAYWENGDPWTNAANVSSNSGNGEGVLFYPGDKVGAPNAAIPSARLKALRDGVEDYDYLTLLAQLGDPGLAAQLATTLAPTWDNWSHNPTVLASAREAAATRIVQLGGQ